MPILSLDTMRFVGRVMRTIIVATSFVLLISAWATAQPATLKGSIRNGSGQTVAGAVATLGNPGGPAVLSMKTDAQGLYQFSGLKVGVYQLRIEANGFEVRA